MFWTFFFTFTGAFWSLFQLMGVIWSYSSNRGYFGLFDVFGGTLVIAQVLEGYW